MRSSSAYRFVRERSGDPRVAFGYVRRIRTFCETLATFPERGTRSDDLAPGLRTMGFERRATVVFAVAPKRVVIVRVFYAGRTPAG